MNKIHFVTICLAAVSFVLNIILLGICRRQFIGLRLNRVMTCYHPTPKISPDTDYVLFLGDSRIKEWDPLPEFEGCEILNLGCGGAISADLLVQAVRMDLPRNIKMAVVEIGINDLTPIGLNPAKKDEIILRCQLNIAGIVEMLHRKNVPVLLLPVLPPSKIGWLRRCIWSEEIDLAIGDVNRFLASLQTDSVVLVDCSAVFQTSERIRREYARDELHLNSKGYEKLNDELVSSMGNLLEKRKY